LPDALPISSEPLRRGNHSHVMSTPQAMASRFADHPEAARETVLLAERLEFDLTKDLGYRYPGADDEGAGRRLAELCGARLQERYGEGADAAEARARLEQELRVISELGLAGFFLLHHDMLELAREIALEVRGPDSVRALLAAAFPTYRARGAIRELGKVLGLPAGEIERLARGAEVYGHSPGHDVPLDAPPPAAWPREHHADSGTASPRWRWLARLVAEAQ